MDFRIADTFTDSLARLTGDEQKAAKTTAFDLQMNPASPGMQFHKLDKARDKNFWSIRVNSDLRIIVHRTADSLLLCYVGHHDDAYQWAERRRLEVHPHTGAAQFVEIRERVEDVVIPRYIEVAQPSIPKPPLFANVPDDLLLAVGVPTEWLGDVHQADEDSLLTLANHLPGEAAEALLNLATGNIPAIQQPVLAYACFNTITPFASIPGLVGKALTALIGKHSPQPVQQQLENNPFEHPDARRRFRTIHNAEELERALEFPWEKWSIFLHPAQREMVERQFNGPARISGSAGTGKTVVALHRAVFLARNHTDSRVLLTTFSDTLASALRTQMRRLVSNEPQLAERLEILSMQAIGERLYERLIGRPQLASQETVMHLLEEAAALISGSKFSRYFLLTEWEEIADAWQLSSWDEYRDVKRLGRKTRLPEAQRALLWSIFTTVREQLQALGMITSAAMFTRLAEKLTVSQHPPFDFTIIDEAQDINIPQLRFLAALGGNQPDGLFFTGDLGQRIFQQPFSWKSLGINVRGRSRTLLINYRTSHQIRRQADLLLGTEIADVDGNVEVRRGTISVFNGPAPTVQTFADQEAEIAGVSAWLVVRSKEGLAPHEIGIIIRSEAELDRARSALSQAGLPYKVLDESVETTSGQASICTMHLAKGLEFRAVVVMACDDEVIPQQSRIETAADSSDLEEVYNTERHLLYVACTRSRDYLFVSSTTPSSEFLEDLSAAPAVGTTQ